MQVNAEKPANTAKDRQRRRKRGKKVKVSKSMPSAVPPLSTGPIPISDAKYADLQSLCTSLHIPVDYHPFYDNLLHTGAAETANTDSISDCENEGVCAGDNSQA